MANEGEFPKSDGDILYASEVNTFVSDLNKLAPIGSIIAWDKTKLKISGTNTSIVANKLKDNNETFITKKLDTYIDSSLIESNVVYIPENTVLMSDLTLYDDLDYEGYVLYHTFTINSQKYISKVINLLRTSNENYAGYCKVKFIYSDATFEEVINSTSEKTFQTKIYTNPYPSKEVSSIEMWGRSISYSSGEFKNTYIYLQETNINIESVDSETELTLEEDFFKNSDIQYQIISSLILDDNYVECNGQTLSDSGSIFNGDIIPDLNGNNNFLRGNSTSGETGTLAATGSADIPYYSIIWIKRIK